MYFKLSVNLFGYSFSGIASISTAVLPAESEIAALILFLLAKCTIAGGTMVIFQFGGELYPTEVRGIGIGLASFLGGVGLTIIPFVNFLGANWLVLPIVIMGVFSVVGGLVTLKLPETLNTKLPQTMVEGEEFGKDFAGWSHTFRHILRYIFIDFFYLFILFLLLLLFSSIFCALCSTVRILCP